jgi:hypothetical protein
MEETNKIYDASSEEQMEKRAIVDSQREDGKISRYNFKILVRDKAPLIGTLSREEVDLMYRLYSNDGANLTQKTVSRHFPLYTFQEFKKILRAFNLTKASVPFAPHIIEEHSEDELIQLINQQKENNFLKKYEQVKEQQITQKYHELLRVNHDLKQSVADFSEFLKDLKFDQTFITKVPTIYNDNTLLVYISDMHIGAEVSDYSVYFNAYDSTEVEVRMIKILNHIFSLAKSFNITNIVVCNIGDSLDGYNAQTTRGGHNLPQNLNNKDQYKTYIGAMLGLFKGLSLSGYFNAINYVCVEGGNHDGDFGYVANKALEASLSYLNPEIEVRIFDKFIEHFTISTHTFMLCHGKDARDMFKNMPLTLNDKMENQINEYIDIHNLTGKLHFIKGDLHRTAITYGKKFRYKSVSSFFGSSEWIHKNFGNTLAACDFDIIIKDDLLETRLLLN